VGKLLKPSPIFPPGDAGLSLALKRGLDSHRPQRTPPRPGFEYGKARTDQTATRDHPGNYPTRRNCPEHEQTYSQPREENAQDESETFAFGVNVAFQWHSALMAIAKFDLQVVSV
jgi:hypothetical protein